MEQDRDNSSHEQIPNAPGRIERGDTHEDRRNRQVEGIAHVSIRTAHQEFGRWRDRSRHTARKRDSRPQVNMV
jgi:hypothetical protein